MNTFIFSTIIIYLSNAELLWKFFYVWLWLNTHWTLSWWTSSTYWISKKWECWYSS